MHPTFIYFTLSNARQVFPSKRRALALNGVRDQQTIGKVKEGGRVFAKIQYVH
jgi:hypothetical protein